MTRIKWTASEIDLIVASYPQTGPQQLSKRLGRSLVSVNNRIRWLKSQGRLPYTDQTGPTITERFGAEVVEFIRTNYVTYGSRYCIDMLKVPLKTVRQVANTLGLKLTQDSAQGVFPYRFDESVISAPTKEFAYFLGFFWGDGHMRTHGNCAIVECVEADLITLASVFESFGHWKRVSRSPNRSDGVKRQDRLTMTMASPVLMRLLGELGYGDKKDCSADAALAWLPEPLRRYWWRGFFDADGHLSFSLKGRYCSGRCLSFTSCYDQDWAFAEQMFRDIGMEECPIFRHVHKGHANHRHSVVMLSRLDQIVKVCEYIYRDYDYIGLARKHLVYHDIRSHLAFREANPYLYRNPTLTEGRAKRPRKIREY